MSGCLREFERELPHYLSHDPGIAACLAPEQITPKGVWVVSADAQMASVSGRVTQQIWKKLNPVWWFLNDDERGCKEMTRKQRFERASSLQHAFRPGAPNGRHHVGRLMLGIEESRWTCSFRCSVWYRLKTSSFSSVGLLSRSWAPPYWSSAWNGLNQGKRISKTIAESTETNPVRPASPEGRQTNESGRTAWYARDPRQRYSLSGASRCRGGEHDLVATFARPLRAGSTNRLGRRASS